MVEKGSGMEHVELLVIGGGAAGQSAAIHAAKFDIRTLLVDEGPIQSEWMSRQVPRWYGERLPQTAHPEDARNQFLSSRPGLGEARDHGVDVRIGCTCWGLFEGRIAGLYDGEQAWFLQAQNILLATGSYEHPLPFIGRSLPGVLGGLGALDLLETQGTLGGERVVVVGSGDFGLEVARKCLEAGHEVAAIVDVHSAPLGDHSRLKTLEQSGVEVIPGYTVIYASGDEQVEQVMLGGVDADGRRLPGESFPVKADTLCVAIDRAPAIDLAYLAGCEFRFNTTLGGHVPRHTESMKTTVPGVFVAGDVAGSPDNTFGRPELAEAQGRTAAISIAQSLSRISAGDAELQRAALRPEASLDRVRQSQRVLDPGSNLWQRAAMEVAPDDIVICRCEGITRTDLVREFEVVGDRIPDELKRVSRAGMGPCQGRGCRLPIAELLAHRRETSPAEVPMASYRPPVRPIPMAALAAIEPPEWPLHPAFGALEREIEAEVAAETFPADRLASVKYKIREENHLASGLSEEEISQRARDLGVTIRTVRVH
jgi:thioredoxin reductase